MGIPKNLSSDLASKILAWRQDPVLFVREVLRVEPDKWQARALEILARTGRVRLALKACAGPGKTALLAWAAWWFLLCFGGESPEDHPNGIAISCDRDNLRDGLWKELARWHGVSPLLQHFFEWTKERIFAKDHPSTWFLAARGYAKAADEEAIGRTLSGLHGRFIFYLVDESGDMPIPIIRSAEQGLTDCVKGMILTAGNTTSTSGLLYHVAGAGRDGWDVISITGDPDDPERSPRVDIEWARKEIARWGRDNAWVMAYILGKFPPGGINTLLSVDDVERAMARHLRPQDYEWSQKRLGVDVARFGDDRTVIFPRQGLVAFNPVVMRHQRTTDIAARVASGRAKWGAERIFVDDTGHWGHGVIDNLLAGGLSAEGIQFHAPAILPQYSNRRAEMWMSMAEWVKGGGALPHIPELIQELSAPTYTLHQGKFLLEAKDQIKKRLGKSPDLGDALALTFAYVDEPAGIPLAHPSLAGTLGKAETDWDPYEEGR